MTDTGSQEDEDQAYTPEELASYRDGVRNLLWILKTQGFLMFALTGLVYHTVSSVLPQDSFFAETSSGLKAPLVSLSDPNMNTGALLNWAAQAATEVMTFGFNDVDRRFARSQRLFSPDGWKSFQKAVTESEIVLQLTENQQLMTAIPREPPRIFYEGILESGDYGWMIEIPILMTIRAGEKSATRRVDITLNIIKMPTAQNPMGLGIQTWYAYS